MDPIPLTWNEALSGVFGSISVACWIFLLIPQLVENYQQKSAQGISLTFIIIWLLGDITNLAGALGARLVPTVIATAIYFCFSDLVLILQCSYYNALNRRAAVVAAATSEHPPSTAPDHAAPTSTSEVTPLLPPSSTPTKTSSLSRGITDITDENLGLPGSRRRRSSAASAPRRASSLIARSDSLTRILEEGNGPQNSAATWIKNAVSVLFVGAVGAAAWAIAWKTGAWRPTPLGPPASLAMLVEAMSGVWGVVLGSGGKEVEAVAVTGETPVWAELMGYLSAVLYLGARIPQIVKNQRERSCDGLSLLFFLLSLMGNASYGAGILFHSLRRDYVLTNLPWLIGSWGTMAEDAIIFVQFSIFGERKEVVEVE